MKALGATLLALVLLMAAPQAAVRSVPAVANVATSEGPPGLTTTAPAQQIGTPLNGYRGLSSWYCSATSACTKGYGPSDMVAAIDPKLGIAKGTWITVRHDGRSVLVKVVDVCRCKGPRLVDLTSGAFSQLAPLSQGVIPVLIVVEGLPVAPETDVEER